MQHDLDHVQSSQQLRRIAEAVSFELGLVRKAVVVTACDCVEYTLHASGEHVRTRRHELVDAQTPPRRHRRQLNA
jgi:hypothetical protein